MNTNYMTTILLFLSKTDPKLYALCPQNVKWTRTGFGLFVLFTGLFAFFTGSYFIRTMFMNYNETTQLIEVSTVGYIISYLIGAVWGMFIMLIEREVVSASSKLSAALRIPLAIFIGLSIAIPFKVQLFSDRINKELTRASRQENMVYEERSENIIGNIRERITDLQEKVKNEREQMAHWAAAMEAEIVGRVRAGNTGLAGEGPAYNAAKNNFELHKAFADDYQNELALLNESYQNVATEARERFEQDRIDQSYDFLSQYQAMEDMKDKDRSLYLFAFMITGLFILVESVPALMKLLKDKDEYDALEEVRTSVSKQLSYAAGNLAMEQIEKNSQQGLFTQGLNQYSPKEVIAYIDQNL